MLLLNNLADDGRPFYNDDLDLLQAQILEAATGTFAALGSFVLSGCQVSAGVAPGTYNITPGLVWLDTLRRFRGVEGVSLPGWLGIGAAVTSGQRVFETSVSKAAYIEYEASWDAVATPVAIAVTVDNSGLTYWQAAAAKGRSLGMVEWLAAYDATEYDANGLGKGAARGWHVCNGVGGSADLRGTFVAGLDPARADYDMIGDTGGEETHLLTIAEMPNHNHSTEQLARYEDVKALPNTGSDNAVRDRGYATLNSAGGDQAHENRPPFYVLFARQWVGYNL